MAEESPALPVQGKPASSSTVSSSQSQTYSAPSPADNFRVFKLLPGERDDPIYCELEPYKGQSYQAISWTWQGKREGQREDIICIGSSRMKSWPNLELMLRTLRSSTHPRYLWLDYLCINMEDRQEWSDQVLQVRKIFEMAQSVCVWLGEEGDDSKSAFQLMRRLTTFTFDNGSGYSTTPREWAALAALMNRPYFCRRWIIQELAFARCIRLHCGDEVVDWLDFTDSISFLTSRAETVINIMSGSESGRPQFPQFLNIFESMQLWPSVRLATLIQGLVRKHENGEIVEVLFDLKNLISQCWMFQQSVPHDIFYSIFPLSSDTQRHPQRPHRRPSSPSTMKAVNLSLRKVEPRTLVLRHIPEPLFVVDYSKSFVKVCEEFVHFTFEEYGDFDILCRPWAGLDHSQTESMPSWLQIAFSAPFEWQGQNSIWTRRDADPLVGDKSRSGSLYNASMASKLLDGWKLNDAEHTLFVQGFILGYVGSTSSLSQAGDIPSEWYAFAEVSTTSAETWPDSFWRTLVADRGPNGANPPAWYRRAFNFLSTAKPNDRSPGSQPKLVLELKRRIQASIWGRRLFRTIGEGWLGLARRTVRNGDVISIIPGCSVPILLRRRNGGRESRFEFLGPCYVHGIMDGEAVELRALHEEQYPIQTFELGYTASTKVEAKSPESLQRYSPSQLHPPDRKDPETLPDDATLAEDDPPPYSSTDPLRDIMEIYFSRLSPIRYTAQSWKEYGILWTCSCGWKGFDIHTELVPGTIGYLVDDFKKAFVTAVAIELPGGHIDRALVISWIRLQNWIKNFPWAFGQSLRNSGAWFTQHSRGGQRADDSPGDNPPGDNQSPGNLPADDRRQRNRLRRRIPAHHSDPDDPTANYMLLCIRDGRWSIARVDIKVNHIVSDQELFNQFKIRYKLVKPLHWLWFSVIQLSRIRFVQFTLRPNSEADRINHDKIPPEDNTYYDFKPRAIVDPPPIGSDYLMHRFHDSSRCRDGTYCLARIPKRKGGKPKEGEPDNGIAWGLYFEETMSYARVAGLSLFSLVLSVSAGALWWHWQDDVKSAVTFASYVLVFELSLVTLLQAALK